MRYAGFDNTALFGGNIEYSRDDGFTDGVGHAVAVTEINGTRYILDMNTDEPFIIESGHASCAAVMRGRAVNVEIERATMLIEYGNNRKIYFWDHEDNG